MSIAFLLFTIRMILHFQFGFKELEMNNYKQKMNFPNESLKTVDFRGFLDAFPVDEWYPLSRTQEILVAPFFRQL